MQPKIESNRFSGFKNFLNNKNIMKQLHNISNQYSGIDGQDPKGYACILDNEFIHKRCLYT
ncbi:hypothetical protein IW16_09065 [Chryseobacterium vrystaatense]|uniref:Uncharacterized protein n=1 Tax=Chryseobacterium vrystaatense TaxID=307480 RepID=A0ABR4UQN2_9FLAO|nr:hypothetical protein IW16_09065 [Chryseobacterium vrystaatense]